ncbi:MAG: hypothetical protein M1838_003197 [Thelocarpon superellum]|nr:MAG: hypothetical protein M1838_003197 [Thelocarpon superellum]
MALANGSPMHIALTPFRAAISKPARRVYISTVLFASTSFILLVLSLVAYILFYVNFVPHVGLERVVHLQFGSGDPHGIVALGDHLASQQAYDVIVTLDLPRSPPNLAAGNFMLDLALLSPGSPSYVTAPTDADVLVRSRRPALLTYTSPLVETANRAANLAWIVLGWRREAEVLRVPMLEAVEFGRGWRNVPRALKLEVQSDEKMAIYKAVVTFTARLTGLRWIMYHHRIISLVVFVSVFYVTSLLFASLAWLLLSMYLSPTVSRPTAGTTPVKSDPDAALFKTEDSESDAFDLSDTPRTFPTYSRQAPLSYPGPGSSRRVEVKVEPDAAADEGEEEGGGGDDGVDVDRLGTASTGRRTDSGLGTSVEEGGSEAAGVPRRRSRGGRGGVGIP